MEHFRQGQELQCIYWPETNEQVRVGENNCTSITVIMENGQMAEVPWAVVKWKSGKVYKWNLSLTLGVEMYPEAKEQPNESH